MAEKNVEVKLRRVRLSFESLFDPDERKDEKTGAINGYAYGGNFLIPKQIEVGGKMVDNPLAQELVDAMKEAATARWGANPPKIPPERKCFRDGEPKAVDEMTQERTGPREPIYEGYEGMYYVSASRTVKNKDDENPVQLLGPRKTDKDPKTGKARFPRLTKKDGMIYSGAVVDAIIRVYAYDGTKGGHPHRINASLEAVKFVEHGQAFGAKPIDADSAFDEEDGDDGFGAEESEGKADVSGGLLD